MRRFLLILLSLAAMAVFFGCSSTPEPEPEVVEPFEQEAPPVADVPGDEPAARDDFSDENARALAAVEAARASAVASGAQDLFPDDFSAADSLYAEARSAVSADSSADMSGRLSDVADRFNAMQVLAECDAMRARISGLGFESVDAALLASGDEASAAARENLSVDGARALGSAREAREAFSQVLSGGFKALCDTGRDKAYAQKELADGIKSSVADKEAYAVAQAALSGADAAYSAGNYEAANDGFAGAADLFAEVFSRVSTKRAAAEEAIARARQKVDTTAVFAAEADEIAPLQDAEEDGK